MSAEKGRQCRYRKMKKFANKILALAMGTFIAATFSGCVDFGDREESSSSRDYTGNETEILVSVYAAATARAGSTRRAGFMRKSIPNTGSKSGRIRGCSIR
ncbi:MAG: hypothetical protein ACLRSW_06000 [Christensenellaceae bacterium]